MEQRRMVTLAEAAALAGTSLDTIRRKLRKGELQKASTNRKGVFVDVDSLREAFDLPADAVQVPGDAGQGNAVAVQLHGDRIAELDELVNTLQAKVSEMQLAEARKDVEHATALGALQSRAAGLEAEISGLHSTLGEARAREAATAADRDAWKAELDRVHELMRTMNERLDEQRKRSWWRRLVG
jgi:chromosome segregation ATPase